MLLAAPRHGSSGRAIASDRRLAPAHLLAIWIWEGQRDGRLDVLGRSQGDDAEGTTRCSRGAWRRGYADEAGAPAGGGAPAGDPRSSRAGSP